MSKTELSRAVIWDLPTRIFHWLFVASFALAWISHDDNRYLFVHVYAGYVFSCLLIFRLVWGIIGTHYARFHSFSHNWTSVTDYMRGLLNGQAMRHIGHNPAGGWAIFIMLMLGILVSITGILLLGGEEGHGPLRGMISYSVGIIAREAHDILAWAMLAFTAAHLVGVFVESLAHKENLIWSMITGCKDTETTTISVRRYHMIGVALLLAVSASALIYFRGYLTETADHLYQPFKGPTLPDNALWRSDCGECHFAFHPTLLPERSWRLLFEQQHEHFGEDLDLDEDRLAGLLDFHTRYSAESELTEFSRKILFYTPADQTPLRITKTHYWVKKHKNIDEEVWKHKKVKIKGNCNACHLDADEGTYEDSNMRLPGKDDAQ